MGPAVDKESLDVNKRLYIMKNLTEIVNEALKDQKKAEVLKAIEIIFNNTREPKEVLEFLWDLFEKIEYSIDDKVKYMSSVNPNREYWEEIKKELDKSLESIVDDIEELEHRK
jgi:exonuclease V gamma subunit